MITFREITFRNVICQLCAWVRKSAQFAKELSSTFKINGIFTEFPGLE